MAQQLATGRSRDVTAPRQDGGEQTRARPIYRPNVDIYETKDRVVILAEMPGVAPDQVDITLERRVLTISGRVAEAAHDGYRRVYTEHGEGDYERVFTISEEIDRDHIMAKQKDGLLTLELPKAAAAKTRRIEVRAA